MRAGFLAALALAVGLPCAATAFTQPGTLEDAAGATDYFRVTCSDDGSGPPASLVAQIRDESPTAEPLVSVQIQRGTSATNSTDAVDGDAESSPLVFVNGTGSGIFDVFVDKTAAGTESYTLTVTCMTGSGGGGVPTGTAVVGSEAPPVAVSVLSTFGALVLGAALVVAGARRRRWSALAFLVFALGRPTTAAAHDETGTLGAAASATDYWEVTCTSEVGVVPDRLSVRVADTGGVAAPMVSVQAHKGLLLAQSTDPVDNDGNPSPEVFVNGGAGLYEVLVDKSGAGAESYTLTVHCQDVTPTTIVHTPTTTALQQDQ
jgi:hypothetical protein